MKEGHHGCAFRSAGFSSCYGKFAAPNLGYAAEHEFCGGHYECCAFHSHTSCIESGESQDDE